MDKKEGYEYALEQGFFDDDKDKDFYKLFKSITRLKNLTSTEKIILTIIMSYTNNKLEFFMSNKILAEETGMNYVSVIRCINNLRDLDYVKTFKKYREGKMIGRVIIPQTVMVNQQLKKSWDNIEYIEYGDTEDDEEF